MANVLDRLKVLIDSSTPIVVMETVEETRAVRLVRVACSALNLTTFEWSIASGLMRSGTTATEVILEGNDGSGRFGGGIGTDALEQNTKALYNSREPAQMLANLEGIVIPADLPKGRAIGRSDPIGAYPAERPVEPPEIVGTIYKSLGFDLETTLPGPAGRPFPLVDFGKHEVKELF